jgi:glycosyltransferase involved in cell wall biosynthesis
MATDRIQAVSLSILHLMRPAQGGMRAQVRSLLTSNSLLAAPPDVLAAFADLSIRATYPLPLSDTPRLQLQYGYSVGRWAKSQCVDILHGHGLTRAMLYVVASKMSRLPLMMTLHNLLTPELWSRKEKIVVKWALRQCKGIICVSKAVAESAKTFVSPSKLRVIYNGVSLLPPISRQNRHSTQLLCVARLSSEKGLSTLIDALALLPENITLRIAGEGPERNSLTAQISRHHLQERVTLLGERNTSEIAQLLTEADIFCQPSIQEGLGIAALEAMAAGLPVVASRVGGLPEVVIDNETGLLFTAKDAHALAHHLQTLIANPDKARQMGEAGQTRVEGYFSVEAMRVATEKFYREILAA